jgi:hypothetical protein
MAQEDKWRKERCNDGEGNEESHAESIEESSEDEGAGVRAGVKIDHVSPRSRRDVAEEK